MADGVDVILVVTREEVGANINLSQALDFRDGIGVGVDGEVQVDKRVAAARGDE